MASYIWCTSLNAATGAVLRHLRNTANKDQATVAEAVNLPTSTISKLESGSANITIEYIYMLCQLYKVSLTDFGTLVELASIELLREKVYIYVEKSKYVDLRASTAILNSKSTLSTVSDALSIGTIGMLSMVSAPIALGVGLATAYQRYKGNKRVEDKLEELKLEIDEIELPLISGQQVYKILKDYLEGLDMENLQKK